MKLTRREFLKASLVLTTAHLLIPETLSAKELKKVKVVKVTDPKMVKNLALDPEVTQRMLDEGIKRLTGKSDINSAWKVFIKPDDRVVIKINCLAGRLSSTNKEIVFSVIKRLKEIGIPEKNIMILDQYKGGMTKAGFPPKLKEGGLRIVPHPSLGYKKWIKFGNHRARISKGFLWASAVINIPVFKDHDLSGITGAMKNIACGVVEKPWLLHRDIHNAIVNFYMLDDIKSRVKLTISDASWVLYNGGPKHNFRYREKYNSIFISKDVVAIDRIQYEVIDSLREKNGLKRLKESGREPLFIKLAEERGLGIGSIKDIELEEVTL